MGRVVHFRDDMEPLLVGLLLAIALTYLLVQRTKKRSSGPQKTLDNFTGEQDAWEGTFWDAQSPTPVHSVLFIEYLDADGLRTQRTVTATHFDKEHLGGVILGHCHLRNAIRTFRTDRIRTCIDSETGHVVPDVMSYLIDSYEHSSHLSERKIRESDYDTLRVLLYLRSSEGQFGQAERDIYSDACKQISSDSRLAHETSNGLIDNLKNMTLSAFKQAVERLSAQPEATRTAVFDAVEKMVSARRVLHATEQDAIKFIRKSFRI
jgi:hypothetical protein